MISESLKTNTTLTTLDLTGDENEVNENTRIQEYKNTRIEEQKKDKRKEQKRKRIRNKE